jgi:16S rRNA processing protein RimM
MAQPHREATEPGDRDLTAIARIQKPVGLKGWCAVAVYGHTLEQVECPCPVRLGRSEHATIPSTMVAVHRDPKGFRCRFARCEDRESAERLREQIIFVPTNRLPRLEEDEFYHFELEGMAVVGAETGTDVGTVVAVHNYPTTDAIEIRLAAGGVVLVPMAGGIIEDIDRAERRIVVRTGPLEELL